MKRLLCALAAFGLAAYLAGGAGAPVRADTPGPSPERTEHVEAIACAVPIYTFFRTRQQSFSRGPINQLRHRTTLSDASNRNVTAPNNDTLYSAAWLDLADTTLVLHVPSLPERYHSVAILNARTDNVAVVGSSSSEDGLNDYLIVGPNWSGEAPPGMGLLRIPTNDAWLIVRIGVGNDDLDEARAAQARFDLRVRNSTSPLIAFDDELDPVPDFDELQQLVESAARRNPALSECAERLAQAENDYPASVWSGDLFAPFRTGLEAAGEIVNGWSYPPEGLAKAEADDALRARLSQSGLAALPRSEAVYMTAALDGDGQPLHGGNDYQLALPATIPADAFWSVTLYAPEPDGRMFLVPNPINRFALRSRDFPADTSGERFIRISQAPPQDGQLDNWLPAPAGPFRLMFRAYLPQPSMLDGSFRLPPVMRVSAFSEAGHVDDRNNGQWWPGVASAEHNGNARASVFERNEPPSEDAIAHVRTTDVMGGYNLVTRNRNELFLLSGTIAESGSDGPPAVIKYDAATLGEVWRTPLPQGAGAWLYPGAVGIHANGSAYAVSGTQMFRLDPQTGTIIARASLPTSQAREDTAYNGYIVMSDGNLLTKSIHRQPGCTIQGFTALIECDRTGRAPSMLVVLEPETLEILWQGRAASVVGGRIMSTIWRGSEFVYLAAGPTVRRMIYENGALSEDPSWGPFRYVRPGERPGTAPVAFGDYIVIQNNATPTPLPLRLTAVSQADDTIHFDITPFGDTSEMSFIPSKPTVDTLNQSVYVVDGYSGTAALSFDPAAGFSVRWRAADRSLAFGALAGTSENRVLASTSIVDALPRDSGWLDYGSEQIVWRRANDGAEIARSSELPPGTGLHVVPGEAGTTYFVSFQGLHEIGFSTANPDN